MKGEERGEGEKSQETREKSERAEPEEEMFDIRPEKHRLKINMPPMALWHLGTHSCELRVVGFAESVQEGTHVISTVMLGLLLYLVIT
jgi:hypothetical protein